MNNEDTLRELLDNTDKSRIWLSSDWHLFKSRKSKEKNDVNTRDIVSYCKKNIKDTDIFMYLGDLTYRWATDKDNEEAKKIYKSIPGRKVLILGNHDVFLGEEFYADCGFEFVYEKFDYENIIFTHRPIRMDLYPEEYWNVHGHIHKWYQYNTTDGRKNINVYPWHYKNKPVTLKYLLAHKDNLIKHNEWNDNNGLLGESTNINRNIRFDDDTEEYDIKLEISKDKSTDELETILNFNMLTELNPSSFVYCGNNHKNMLEFADYLLEMKRSQLPEEEFGIPEEKKYPLDTEAHVRSAIKFFNYVDKKYEKKLALNIRKKMKKFNITDVHISKKNRLSKYINEFCIETCDYLINRLIKHEYSMASMNPIKGITRPYVIVAVQDDAPIKHYAFSSNLISSRYLTIDENGKLELVDASYFDNMKVDVYDFVGEQKNVKKIYESYKNKEDDLPMSYIYESLSGKKLLHSNQIDYDNNFRKIETDTFKAEDFIGSINSFI